MATDPKKSSSISADDRVVAWNLGSLANAWRFHRQLAHSGRVGPSGNTWRRRHGRAADQAVYAMQRSLASSSLDDPDALKMIISAASREWQNLAAVEDYFTDRAQWVQETFAEARGRQAAAKCLSNWLNDDVVPIAEMLRQGLRAALSKSMRLYFDLGTAFDQGWRRLDSYAYVRQALGKPILVSHIAGWAPWGPLGPTAGELEPIVDQIVATRADESGDELEAEVDLSDSHTHGEVDDEDCVAPYDVPPGSLAPEDGWFTMLREWCRKCELPASAGRVAELSKACRAALRGEIFREEWLLKLVEFRDEMLVEMRRTVPAAERPWSSWDRDLWLYQQDKQGVPRKQLPALLQKMVPGYGWEPIELKRVAEVIKRVAVHLGDKAITKRKRGRPKKPR